MFNVLRVILYPVHNYLTLITPEVLSHFPFQPRFVEDVVLEDSGIPSVVELIKETIGGICYSLS